MTILQELFCGNIFPHNGTFERDSEYGRAIHLIDCYETKLLALLNDNEKSITAEENFIQGFKMGALIVFEVFEKQR